MPDRDRANLDERIDELERALEALRDELRTERRPMALPRPPRPREFLRFTDRYAIPAAIAAMEANIRALELVQAGIRATDAERAADETGREVWDRTTDAGRATLDRLDRAMADLESAMEGSEAPRNPEARELLSEVRRLNEEIRNRLAVEGGAGRDDAVRIEVESELATIKDEVAGGDAPDDGDDPVETDDSE